MNILSLQDYGNQGEKAQDYETKIQHQVPCKILVYATVQNKLPARLLNFILDSRGTDTMINW